jgi:hypothetical protein
LTAAKQLIWIFDVVQEYRLLSQEELQFYSQLRQRYLGLIAVDKLRAKQCSRLSAVRATGTNSKLFFLRVSVRRRKNFIQGLQHNGTIVYAHQDKEQAVSDHFSSSFSMPEGRSHNLN